MTHHVLTDRDRAMLAAEVCQLVERYGADHVRAAVWRERCAAVRRGEHLAGVGR